MASWRVMRFFVALSVLLALPACTRKPCDHGRSQPDDRPLPSDWASAGAAPEGSALCFDHGYKPDRENQTYVREYDVPAKTAEDAHQKWIAALTTKGWTKTPASRPKGDYGFDPEACALLDRFDHASFTMHLKINTCGPKPLGWTRVVFERRDKK